VTYIPLTFHPPQTYEVDWDAACPACGDWDAHWWRSPRGTGLADPVIWCPTCNTP
jgi:hypothetical protein